MKYTTEKHGAATYYRFTRPDGNTGYITRCGNGWNLYAETTCDELIYTYDTLKESKQNAEIADKCWWE